MIQVTVPDLPEDIRKKMMNEHEHLIYESVAQLHESKKEKISVIVTYGGDITVEMLKEYPNLKWIQIFQTGVHHLPLKQLEERNIILTNIRGIYGTPISEYVLSFILYFVRDIERYTNNKSKRFYERSNLPDEACGKTIVILGAGTIGTAIAEMAKKFNMKVIGINTSGNEVPHFDDMYSFEQMSKAMPLGDFIVSILPVTEKTKQCLTKKEFELMKSTAYFFNIGRAELINEQHLIEHLQNNKIRGAVLDVFNQEPLPSSSPLWDVQNLYLTPHISGKTIKFFTRCLTYFESNLAAFKQGLPLQFVFDYEKGY